MYEIPYLNGISASFVYFCRLLQIQFFGHAGKVDGSQLNVYNKL